MSEEQRRIATRERVKAWKKAHPWLLQRQNRRAYARRKLKQKVAAAYERQVGIKEEVRAKVVVPRVVQETHYGPVEGVDTAYEENRWAREERRREVARDEPGAGEAVAREASLAGVRAEHESVPEEPEKTAHERWVKDRLAQMVAKQAASQPGVAEVWE